MWYLREYNKTTYLYCFVCTVRDICPVMDNQIFLKSLIFAAELQSHLAFWTICFVIRTVKIHSKYFVTLSLCLLASLSGNN